MANQAGNEAGGGNVAKRRSNNGRFIGLLLGLYGVLRNLYLLYHILA